MAIWQKYIPRSKVQLLKFSEIDVAFDVNRWRGVRDIHLIYESNIWYILSEPPAVSEHFECYIYSHK